MSASVVEMSPYREKRKRIAATIAALCEKRGIQPGDAAARLEVSRITWWRWTTGRTSIPTEMLPFIASMLGVVPGALIGAAARKSPAITISPIGVAS